jgi:hypothetical protein
VVSIAAVFCASFNRRAMVWRSRVIFTRSSRPASSAGTGARGAGAGAGSGGRAAGAGDAARSATARATSSFITRPSRPVPVTRSRVSPASAIAFLAAGPSSGSRGAPPPWRATSPGFASAGVSRVATSPARAEEPPAATRQHASGLHRAAFVDQYLRQPARSRGRHLDRDLVGFQLAQHFVARDRVTHRS